MTSLNVGQGRCIGTARLLIRPVQAVIELGAAGDLVTAALRAVHHANRHGSVDDFIAVALPGMRMGRDAKLPGHDLELIGSEVSLNALIALDGIATLKRRGMLQDMEIGETFADAGMTGAAYTRDQSSVKHTPGWIRRSKARAERRGQDLGKRVKARRHDTQALVLRYGDAVLHIREVIGEFKDDPLMVSTYGFSGQASPAILPVFPDSLSDSENAA